MPRNSSGTYTLPTAAFVPGGLIKSADENSNFSDIATALSQSLATTGVSTMTGPIKAASGTLAAPSYAFNSATATGFYLAGANQIAWSSNGVQGATFNADSSITWIGPLSFTNTGYTFSAGSRAALHTALGNSISVQLIIDGAGNTITTGIKGFIEMPCQCTVNQWTVAADQSGSIVVDIWRLNAAIPSVANTIAGSALPTLSSAQYNSTTTLTGWTTTLVPKDIIAFNVNSATSVQRATVSLTAVRT